MSFLQRLMVGRGPAQEPDAEPFDDQQIATDLYADYADEGAAPPPERYEPATPGSVLFRAEPLSFKDAGLIVDRLREGQPVVVSFEQTDQAEARRIRDFLRGAAYALDGDVRKVASHVYVCLPHRMQYEKLPAAADEPAPHVEAGPQTSLPADPWQQ